VTWEQRTIPGSVRSLELHPEDPEKLWTASWNVAESSDGGATWDIINDNLPNVLYRDIVYQPGTDDGVYVVANGILAVYYLDNTLTSWVDFSDQLPNTNMPWGIIEVSSANGKLRIGSWGRGIWETDLYSTNTAYTVTPPLPPTLVPQFCSDTVHITATSPSTIDSVYWYLDTVFYAKTTSTVLSAYESGIYRARIFSGVYSSYLSDPLDLTFGPPGIISQPSNVTLTTQLDMACFEVGTANTGLTYLWQVSTNNGTSFSDVVCQPNTNQYCLLPDIANNGDLFRAIVSDDCGRVDTSANAALDLSAFVPGASYIEDTESADFWQGWSASDTSGLHYFDTYSFSTSCQDQGDHSLRFNAYDNRFSGVDDSFYVQSSVMDFSTAIAPSAHIRI